jgi:gamma-glutamyltranspeptidase
MYKHKHKRTILTGAAAAWVDTVKEFGSGKVTLAEILDPAIRMAEEGCVLSQFDHKFPHPNFVQCTSLRAPQS